MARYLVLSVMFALTAAGCAKNVDKIQTTKWGNSFIPDGRHESSTDLSAQGGAAGPGKQIPKNDNNKIPKASLGGTYHRTFATSPHYRMMGGFHVAGQGK